MGPEETALSCSAILDELERAVVGRRRTLELVLIGVLAGGHVLLEDLPGLGKTLIARSFARVLGLDFARIQFTPDLLPSDVVGAPLYDQRSAEMVFRPGPVFTQLLLADEINRTPPKTQAALLEAMGEGQVSVDGQTRRLPQPFIVLATDNPIEYEGTYELPEAQLDRFLMRLRLGYLSRGDETDMLRRRVGRTGEYVELNPVTGPDGVLAMRESLEQVEIAEDLLDYVVAIVTATRKDVQVQVGASPRGGLALVQLARGQALLNKRDYVIPDDIKQVAVPALAHRVTLRPELWVRQVSADDVVAKLLAAVPTPKTDPQVWAMDSHDELSVRWRSSRHARRLLTLGLAGLFVATIARRPEFAGLAAPALLLLAAGRTQQRPPRISVQVRPSTRRAFEGEPVALDVTAEGQGDCSVRWTLRPGPEIEIAGPVGATAADGAQARFIFSAQRWGRRRIGAVDVILRDRWRLAEGHLTVIAPRLDCYPAPAQQRTTVVLSRLPNRLGEHQARTSGEGIEFAGVREYVPGDRQRSINWPASTRRGRLQVNTFAAERSQDVVLLADATSDVGEPGSSAVDLALRGATAAARAYTEARDRVGVITYQWGGASWLAPGLGRRQVYRIIDSMLASDAGLEGPAVRAHGANFRRLPRAALPPGALVVVFSPLLDQRFVEALRDMRERGFTMLVVDVLNAEPPARPRSTDRLARRIWRMEQEAIRFSLRELGIPVVHWDGVQSLDLPLAGYTRRPLVVRR